MSTNVIDDPGKQTTAALLGGIFVDLQHLVQQQFSLTRREITDELRQRAAAGAVIGSGVGIAFLGLFVLCLGLAHLLHWVASPSGADVAWLPLWACHALVALVLVTVGGILVQVGRARFNAVPSFHNPVTEILQENDQWTTHPR